MECLSISRLSTPVRDGIRTDKSYAFRAPFFNQMAGHPLRMSSSIIIKPMWLVGISIDRKLIEVCRPIIWGKHTAIFADGLDRKSTRLNSSHEKISYAVVC